MSSASNSESLAQVMKLEELSEEKVQSMKEETKEEEMVDEEKKKKVTVLEPSAACEVEKGSVVSDLLVSKKEMMWWWSLLGVRIAALLFCLTAFAVLAANKQKVVVEEEFNWLGWDSTDNSKREEQSYSFRWDDYEQFTYCVAVNVIGFVYSALQIGDLVKFLITKKHTVNPKLRGYFNFAIDQALTYLLLSASSAAATTIRVYKSGWVIGGGHTFIEMANASVALSFLAFVAFALASLASGFTLAKF